MTEEKTPSVEEQVRMAMQANAIAQDKPQFLAICGNTYKLRRISNKIAAKICNLAYEALYLEKEAAKEGLTCRQVKRINLRLRQIPAKMAAYYNLGRWAHIRPLWAVRWRQLWNRSEEVSATINATCTTGSDKDFFLANSEIIKYQLALSMRRVGESVRQMLERKESAESMLDADASPKKEEGSK